MDKDEELYKEIASFMNEIGWEFNIDDDGMYFEDYCTDHKWKDIFMLMNAWHQRKTFLNSKNNKQNG